MSFIGNMVACAIEASSLHDGFSWVGPSNVFYVPVSSRRRSVFAVGGSGDDLTPVGKRRCAALFECFPAEKMAVQVKITVAGGVDRGELL